MDPYSSLRHLMVEKYLAARGVEDERVLDAFRAVPREKFLPEELAEFAYVDAPLPIAEAQTISQPFIVAVTVAALKLRPTDRVLEVGTGSGYAAAVLARVAREVYTVERLEGLATSASQRLAKLGYDNVHVLHGDGTLGWPEHAPFDAIAVAAGGPSVPLALRAQLAVGGRLVIPVGPSAEQQQLLRVTRTSETTYTEEPLVDVRFVPLVGSQGWSEAPPIVRPPARRARTASLGALVREEAFRIDSIDTCSVDALLERVGDARVVLLGEATHGTSEFYRMRARITRALIEKRGFHFVAVEGDWPDVERLDGFVLGRPPLTRHAFRPFERFPTWMWRNTEFAAFVDALRSHNAQTGLPRGVGLHGLDLYSMFTSIATVLAYLDEVDPTAASVARARYGLLTPWQKDPAAYGEAVVAGSFRSCEPVVVAILREMLERRVEYAAEDGERFFDAAQNARVVANAEQYYRAMYNSSAESWNLRDHHMFDTLRGLLAFYGPRSKGVVWEHNSHVGDASATDLAGRGETNVGELCRRFFGTRAYAIGFGTDRGTVAAADRWGSPMEVMNVRAAHPESFEGAFHASGLPACMLHLREPRRRALRDDFLAQRLERAIGVVYKPETEMQSHYFFASLAQQFDEYVWFDETHAITPLPRRGHRAF